MPPDGTRCLLNIPGHLIIAIKKIIKLPSNEMEKTATSDNYIVNNFPIFRKRYKHLYVNLRFNYTVQNTTLLTRCIFNNQMDCG